MLYRSGGEALTLHSVLSASAFGYQSAFPIQRAAIFSLLSLPSLQPASCKHLAGPTLCFAVFTAFPVSCRVQVPSSLKRCFRCFHTKSV